MGKDQKYFKSTMAVSYYYIFIIIFSQTNLEKYTFQEFDQMFCCKEECSQKDQIRNKNYLRSVLHPVVDGVKDVKV